MSSLELYLSSISVSEVFKGWDIHAVPDASVYIPWLPRFPRVRLARESLALTQGNMLHAQGAILT